MKNIEIKTEYITLCQLIKYIGLISQGSEIKSFLDENKILVNNELENRRGKKLYRNDVVDINDILFKII